MKKEPVDWKQEIKWFQNNKWVFDKYKNEWVAVKQNTLIAHDAEYQKVLACCERKNINNPFIEYVTAL